MNGMNSLTLIMWFETSAMKLNDFFNNVNGYNDHILEQHGILDIWNRYKSDYADYILGKKIEKCLLENKECVVSSIIIKAYFSFNFLICKKILQSGFMAK